MTDTKRLEELLEAIRLAVYLRPSNFEDARTTYEYIEKHIRTLLEEKDKECQERINNAIKATGKLIHDVRSRDV